MLPNRPESISEDVAASLGDALLVGAGGPVKRLFRAVVAEWTRNGSKALQAAEAASGLSREELEDQLRQDPRLHPLLTRLLYAAGMNGHDGVLRAMGTALGEAVHDRDRIDECELILVALTDLSAAHAGLLKLLATPVDDGNNNGAFWTQETLLASSGLPEPIGPLVLAALISRGLAEVPPMVLGAPVKITTLGSVVLRVLEQWQSVQDPQPNESTEAAAVATPEPGTTEP